MMATDSLKNDLLKISNHDINYENGEVDISGTSSDTGSEISLSEKIIIESNEKRLRKRMSSLQTSIVNLREQLKMEKEMWKEDLEQIKALQKQHENHICPLHQVNSRDICRVEDQNRSNSLYSISRQELNHVISPTSSEERLKKQNIKQLLEVQHYKRKLAETENMCHTELLRVKQSLQDLKLLKTIASGWGDVGKEENQDNFEKKNDDKAEQIYIHGANDSQI